MHVDAVTDKNPPYSSNSSFSFYFSLSSSSSPYLSGSSFSYSSPFSFPSYPKPLPVSAPRAATSLLFRGVTNTSLEITWSGPVDSDYDDFELQWSPRDRLSVINPYYSRTSCSRILKGMYPGRLYTFSLRTVSGATQLGVSPSYSTAIQNSIRTSRWQHLF